MNIEWADPFFNNAIVNNNVQYAAQFLDNHEISVQFLEKVIKRFELFSTLFRQQQQQQQTIAKSSSNNQIASQLFSSLSSSPLPTSFISSLSQIRSEMELQKIFLILEQIMESILCNGCGGGGGNPSATNDTNESSGIKFTTTSYLKINLHDRYRLARRLNSRRILRNLMALNRENSAHLLDWLAHPERVKKNFQIL